LGFFLNLEQAELLRIQRYNEGWRFYFGKHWLFKREDGEPLVTFNYYRKIIDKAVAFLVAKGFQIRTPESLELVTKPFLDEVWEYNARDPLAWDIATTGGVTGDVFLMITYEEPSAMQRRINPFSQGHIRVNLLGSEQVYPTWDPLNTDTLIAARIETIYYAERGTRQLDREDRVNHEGRQLYTKRFTQIITRDQIVEQYHGDQPMVRPNVLGEIPLVHIRNLGLPKEYYGLPDGADLIDLQREFNEKATDISDVINYHSAPVTVVTGAKAKQLERGPRQIWSGLPKDASVFNLKLEGDLTAAQNYLELVKKCIHELSDTPEGSLGAQQPISNTSGVALHMQYQPLIEKTQRKKAQYEPGFEQVNYFMLRIGMVKGLINLPFDLCKHCGGRIIEVATGKTTKIWNPDTNAFVDQPIHKKRCYHIDKQTLEFTDPKEMRLKYWRQHGFGAELRDMTLKQILDEITNQRRSFWDYTVVQEAQLEQWRQQNTPAIQAAHTAQVDNLTPPEQPPTPEGVTPPPPQPHLPPVPQALIPQIQATPPKIQEPPMLRIQQLPMGEVDLPEEPEKVTVERHYLDPNTGRVSQTETVEMFLVPTGCKRSAYLNPFETKVEFNSTLPKDEALEEQRYRALLDMQVVDREWVQDRIPDVAVQKTEINKRLKPKFAVQEQLKPQQQTTVDAQGASNTTTMYGGELAPGQENPAAVPGPGGNPVDVTQQIPQPSGGVK
jgi:hypothetical protein